MHKSVCQGINKWHSGLINNLPLGLILSIFIESSSCENMIGSTITPEAIKHNVFGLEIPAGIVRAIILLPL